MGKIRKKDLENGNQNPGASKYYGTNELNETGFHQVPGAISALGTKTLATYGESIGAGKPAFFGKGNYINVENVNIIDAIGNAGNTNIGFTTSIRVQQPFYVGKYNNLRSIAVQLLKVGGPTDNVSMLIYDTDRTTLIATSTTFTSIANPTNTSPLTGSIITAGYLTYAFQFNNLQLQSYKTYWIELRRSAVPDGANYYAVSYMNSQSSKWNVPGSQETYNGTTWDRVFNSDEGCLRTSIQYSQLCEAGKVYVCNSDYIEKSMTECITEESKLATESGLVTLQGLNTNFSRLIKGNRYNLANYTVGGEQVSNYNATIAFGYAATDNEKAAQSFSISKTTTISKLMLSIIKTGAPTDDAIIRIETNDPFTNLPSGNLAHANATMTLPYHRFTTWHNMVAWDFNGSFDLISGETYWIVLSRSGALNTSNYYNVSIQNTNVYGRGRVKEWENTAWTDRAYSFVFNFMTNLQEMGYYDAAADSYFYVGYDTDTHYAHAQSFMVTKAMTVNEMYLRLQKMGSPTQGVRVRIEGNRKNDIATATNLYKNVSGNTRKNFGDTTTKKLAMKFRGTENLSARFLTLYFNKVLTPSDNVNVRIETDNAGAPSGTLVSMGATATFDTSLYAKNASFYAQFDFVTPINMLSGVDYWIVVSRTGTDSAVNYFRVYYQDNVYSNGAMSTSVDGNAWIVTVNDMMFYFSNTSYEGGNEPSGELIDSNATAVVAAASMANSYNRKYKFAFSAGVILQPNTVYWIVVEPENKWEDTTNYYRIWAKNGVVAPFQFTYKKLQKTTNYWTINNGDRRFRWSFINRMEPNEGEVALNPGTYYGSSLLATSDTAAMFTKSPTGKTALCGQMSASTTYYFLAQQDGIFFMYGATVSTSGITIREYLDTNMITETENFDLAIGAIALTTTYSFPMTAGRYYKIILPATAAPKYRLLSV